MAAPKACAIVRRNATAAQLEQEFYDFLYNIKYNPIRAGPTSVVDYEALKTVVVGCIYAPNSWGQLAGALYGLYNGHVTAFADLSGKFTDSAGISTTADAEASIKCSDKTVGTSTKQEMMPHVYAKYNISKTLGDVYVASDFERAQWKMHAEEVYKSDFCVKTKNPVLLVCNTYDPLTPLVSAKNMSSGFDGSVVVEQVAYGVSEPRRL